MSALFKLAEDLLVAQFVRAPRPLMARNRTGLGLRFLFGLSVLAGLGFLVHALYLHLNTALSPAMASVIVGGVLFIAAAIIRALSRYAYRRRVLHMTTMQTEMEATINRMVATAGEGLGGTIRDNPKSAMVIAAIAGAIAAQQLRRPWF